MMDDYFEEWEVMRVKHWPFALFTNPNLVTDQNPAPGLVLAGDQNDLGMEPAAISGIYAANKVMGKTVDWGYHAPTLRPTKGRSCAEGAILWFTESFCAPGKRF